MDARASGVAKGGVRGNGAMDLELPDWACVWERVVGARLWRFRKGICCCEKTGEGITGDSEMREWGWQRGPRSGAWAGAGRRGGCHERCGQVHGRAQILAVLEEK